MEKIGEPKMLYPDGKIQPQSTSLVFIDAHLNNYQFLATGVVNDVEVIIIDPTENGQCVRRG